MNSLFVLAGIIAVSAAVTTVYLWAYKRWIEPRDKP